jgi:hypothetical protein
VAGLLSSLVPRRRGVLKASLDALANHLASEFDEHSPM